MKNNRYLFALLTTLVLTCSTASAQRNRGRAATPKPSAIQQAQQAIAEYRFEEAEEILNKEIAALERKRQATIELEILRESARNGRQKLAATERMVVIDSVVVKASEALSAIKLSHESGRIDTYASTYHVNDSTGCTIYENDLGNRRYLAIPTNNGGSQLAVTDLIGTNWSEPVILTGLYESLRQNYPFLMADGVTLYYAATGNESIGGYDIFVTRADGNEGECLKPENIGFPYNSTANDYLLAIDEQSKLGWFVTDRLQTDDNVCIYTFIPNETRDIYPAETEPARLRSLAKLNSIKDTWENNSEEIKQAQHRLAALRNGNNVDNGIKSESEFNFVVNDQLTYTKLSDFKNDEARQMLNEWLQLSKDNNTDGIMLERLRDKYADASVAERKQLAASIMQMEATYYPRLKRQNELAKAIRRLELQH